MSDQITVTPTDAMIAATLSHIASIVTAREKTTHAKHGVAVWKPGADGKKYTQVANLGQIHVNFGEGDDARHFGLAVTLYDYGQPSTKTALRDTVDTQAQEIAALKAELAKKST